VESDKVVSLHVVAEYDWFAMLATFYVAAVGFGAGIGSIVFTVWYP
jgi:hypothetical protein